MVQETCSILLAGVTGSKGARTSQVRQKQLTSCHMARQHGLTKAQCKCLCDMLTFDVIQPFQALNSCARWHYNSLNLRSTVFACNHHMSNLQRNSDAWQYMNCIFSIGNMHTRKCALSFLCKTVAECCLTACRGAASEPRASEAEQQTEMDWLPGPCP